jgi:hypothetical protein
MIKTTLDAGPAIFFFINRPHSVTINQSRRIEFQCSIRSTLTPTFKWNFTRKGSTEAETIAASGVLSAGYSIVPGHRSQVLIIPSVQWRHEGVYTCIVSSENSQIQAEANLNVLSKQYEWYTIFTIILLLCTFPSYEFCIVPLTNLSIRGDKDNSRELDTVIIECDAIANPHANITWFKRTSERVRALTSNPKTSITHQLINSPTGPFSSSTLIVRNLEESDSADYICEARNNYSSSESVNFNFTVMSRSN